MSQLIASSYTLVLGLGIAGTACARHLLSQGVPCKLADTRSDAPGLAELLAEYPGVEHRCGDLLSPEWVAQAHEIVVAPGLALDHPMLAHARAAGVPVLGEMDLLRRSHPDVPVVAITGTNGKSTVTALVGEMLKACGVNAGVGGNLGRPVLDLVKDDPELLVLELSSFQLERCQAFHPKVATVLNMSPDHLDRHGDMPSYYQAKHQIFRGADACVVNYDDALSRPLIGDNLKVVEFTLGASDFNRFGIDDGQVSLKFEPLIGLDQIALKGQHNLANAMAAIGIVHALDLPLAPALEVLVSFQGLPHRSRDLGEIAGVRVFNDSKGTNEGASAAALAGLASDTPGTVRLLAGGDGKGSDFATLHKAIRKAGARVIGFGRDGAKICAPFDAPVVESLEQALDLALAEAEAGDAILLSPACASFDQFPNYVARGEYFEALVEARQ